MEALGYNPALYITCNSYTDGAKFLNQEWFVTPYSNVTPGFYYSDNFPDHYSNGNNAGNYFYNYPPGTTKNIYCESVVPLNYNIEYNGQPTSNFNVSVISGAHALYPGACDWACMGEGGTVYGGGGGVGLVAPPVGNIGNHVYNQSVAMVDYLRKLSIAKGSDSVAEYLSKSDNPQSIKISGLHQLINGTGKGTGSEYTNLIKEAKQSGASIYKLSSEHLSRLTDLANSNTTDKIYAQNLLSINTGRPSLRKPLLLPKNKTNKVSQNANTTIETISSNNLFSIYPNPSSASITATLAIPNPGNKIYTVELYSLLGVKLIAKEVDPTITKQVIFDLSYLTTGVYFAKLISSDGELIGVKSFVVNKN